MRSYAFEQSDSDVIRPAEAAHVRDWAARALAGESITSLVADARRRDIRTVTGRHWRHTSLKRVLLHPKMRVRVLKAREYDQLAKKLGNRVQPGPTRRYLLTGGLARCGICGSALSAWPARRVPSYGCRKTPEGGCGRIRMTAQRLEDHVVDTVLAYLSQPHIRALVTPNRADLDAIPERIADLEERLAELGQDYAEGVVDKPVMLSAQARLRTRIGELRKLADQGEAAAVLSDISPESLSQWWESAPLNRRRQLVTLVLVSVTVNPVAAPDSGIDDRMIGGRISPVWRFS